MIMGLMIWLIMGFVILVANLLYAKDKSLGYQCDYCADAAEGIGFHGEY